MQDQTKTRIPLRPLENLAESKENSIEKGHDDAKKRFNSLIKQGRKLQKGGDVEKALQLYLEARSIVPNHEKLNKKINSLQTIQNRLNSLKKDKYGYYSSQDDDVHILNPEMRNPYAIPSNIYNKLYGYQKESVKWMWNLFKSKTGGVLGDDMGLGKTVQVCSFLRGLIHSEFVDKILLILPLSIMSNWENEIKKWCGDVPVVYFHGSKPACERNLRNVLDNSGIVLTTYGTVQINFESLCEFEGENIVWDAIILDEGHNIKNPGKKTTKAVNCLSGRTKIVLTGTPIMNNLTELWSLFNFCCNSDLLGDLALFKALYAIPISDGNMKNASPSEIERGFVMANRLRSLIEPHFLRREKSEVLEVGKNLNQGSLIASPKPKMEVKKVDLICWTYMTDLQTTLYKKFLKSEATTIDDKLISKRTPFEAILALKNISLHPSLLQNHSEYSETLDLSNRLANKSLIEQSGKLTFLVELLKQLKRDNHKVLIFSQRVAMLNIIQTVMNELDFSHARIDGNVKEAHERQCIVDDFNNSPNLFALLLTTKVGGVGLNLTSADRVIIFDPSWNLATDDQSVDRAYRIGQKRDVVIYRLMTCGTIEEKIYRRQIFKGSLSQTMTSKVQQHFGYFSKGEMRDMFEFAEEDARKSATHLLLSQLIAVNLSNELYKHNVSKLSNIDILYGVSDHSLLFTDESNAKLNEISQLADSEGFENMFAKFSEMSSNLTNNKDIIDAFQKLSLKTKTPAKEKKKKKNIVVNKVLQEKIDEVENNHFNYVYISDEEVDNHDNFDVDSPEPVINLHYNDDIEKVHDLTEENYTYKKDSEFNMDEDGILSDGDLFDDALFMDENKDDKNSLNEQSEDENMQDFLEADIIEDSFDDQSNSDEYHSIEDYDDSEVEKRENINADQSFDELDKFEDITQDDEESNGYSETERVENLMIGKDIFNQIERELISDNENEDGFISNSISGDFYKDNEIDNLVEYEKDSHVSEVSNNEFESSDGNEDDLSQNDESDIESFDGEIDEKSLLLQRLMTFDDPDIEDS